MYLYRALNEKDRKELSKSGNIYSSLYYKNPMLLKRIYYSTTEFDRIKNHLDEVLSHVGGQILGKGESPWISTSKDLDFVMSEYAVPQCGKYNMALERKPIAVIEEENIYDNVNDLVALLNNLYSNKSDYTFNVFALDLCGTRLNDYYTTEWIKYDDYKMGNFHIIDRSSDNLMLPYVPSGEAATATLNELFGSKERYLTGFKKYSDKSSEVLFATGIPKNDIKYILSPLLQDIMYASNNYDVDGVFNNISSIDDIVNKSYKRFDLSEQEIFDKLYNEGKASSSYTSTYQDIKYLSLVDLIDPNICSRIDINRQYEILKKVKKGIISTIVDSDMIRLVDDEVLVGVDGGIGTSSYDINDLVKYQKGNEVIPMQNRKDSKDYIQKNVRVLSNKR